MSYPIAIAFIPDWIQAMGFIQLFLAPQWTCFIPRKAVSPKLTGGGLMTGINPTTYSSYLLRNRYSPIRTTYFLAAEHDLLSVPGTRARQCDNSCGGLLLFILGHGKASIGLRFNLLPTRGCSWCLFPPLSYLPLISVVCIEAAAP